MLPSGGTYLLNLFGGRGISEANQTIFGKCRNPLAAWWYATANMVPAIVPHVGAAGSAATRYAGGAGPGSARPWGVPRWNRRTRM